VKLSLRAARLRKACTVVEREEVCPYEVYELRENWGRVEAAMGRLKPREAEVIKRRFGLHGKGEETFKEISKYTGVTPQTTHQIYNKAMRIIKRRAADMYPLGSAEEPRKAKEYCWDCGWFVPKKGKDGNRVCGQCGDKLWEDKTMSERFFWIR